MGEGCKMKEDGKIDEEKSRESSTERREKKKRIGERVIEVAKKSSKQITEERGEWREGIISQYTIMFSSLFRDFSSLYSSIYL